MEVRVSPSFEQHLKTHRVGDQQLTRIGQCSRRPEAAFEEAKRAAERIGAFWLSEQIVLCLSGGADSTAMAEAFLAAKVPFSAALMKMKGNLNFHDIAEALVFCDKNQIQYQIVEVDPQAFFEGSSCSEIAEIYQCSSPMLALHIGFLDQIKGIPILAGNPPRVEIYPDYFDILLPSEPHLALFRYFQKRAGVPFFFLYTPELCCSFLNLPELSRKISWIQTMSKTNTEPERSKEDLVKSHKTRNHSSYLEKLSLYKAGGFQSPFKPFRKTGFDALLRYYSNKHPDLGEAAFDKLFRRPLLERFPMPKQRLHFIHKADLGFSELQTSKYTGMDHSLVKTIDS